MTKKDIDIEIVQRQLAATPNDPNLTFTIGPHVHFEWDNDGNFLDPITKEIIHPGTKESKKLVNDIRQQKEKEESGRS